MRRRGFTIIELTLVCGIIAVLLGIVLTAANGSLTAARSTRRTAIFTVLQQGLLTYQAQKGQFPVEPGTPSARNDDQKNGTYTYTAGQVRQMIRALVDEAKSGNVLIDISALHVSKSPGEMTSKKARGMDFMTAIHGTRDMPQRMRLDDMYFGYPEDDGTFRRPSVVYSIQNDTILVQALENEKQQ